MCLELLRNNSKGTTNVVFHLHRPGSGTLYPGSGSGWAAPAPEPGCPGSSNPTYPWTSHRLGWLQDQIKP